ncbi:hypothetical protein COV18_04855 [Candidatus Woesearchaeota archaeon CG10_big_fil_rev_8_21_14_0_10_37_12]|nr:MAG: hypothetical protein COV18_04855 [Candidatus Woesearchaeota archaeon CG10_big_fil_rev_8_21_14_0_10_37_12]
MVKNGKESEQFLELKTFHAKQIRENILNKLIHNKETGCFYSPFDSSKRNFCILFYKDNIVKSMIQYSDLENTKDDSRQIFVYLRQLNPEAETKIVLDFDKNHDKHKKIHLNTKIPDNFLNKKAIDKINHLAVVYSNNRIDYFKTFFSMLVKLKETGFFNEFNEYSIYQLDIDSEEYKKIDKFLKM